jgi:murein endopeptidase
MPNRPWRRWGTEELVDLVQDVTGAFAIRHPDAPPLLVGDLSRPYGGEFGRRFGGLGHASHQNGLDADVSYPRRDGLLRSARRPGQVDRALAQDLVDRFVAAGAEKVFVGPRLGLTGPRRVVVPLVHHDDHLHVRIPRPRR